MKSVANSTHRLLIVAPSAYTLGGLAVWLDYLIPGLSQLGWDVTLGLVSGPRHHNVKAYLDRYTVPRAIAIHCHCSTDAGRVHAVRTAIQKVDPDIVLTVNIPHAIRATALERNSGRDVRAVMSCHGIQEDLFEDMKILQEDLDAVVCTNRLASRLSQTLGGIDSERVFHCACGAVVPKHLPDLPDNTSFTIGYSGRLEQSQKRVHDLVPVAAELKSKGLNFKVLVAGSGPEEQQLNDAINQHGLTEHFGLLGFVPAEEMQDCFYTKLDALLVTSSWETGPIVIWEAMAAGTPVVTSRYIGSGAEGLLCHVRNCLMFDVGDCDSAAAQLMLLRDDPTMNQQIRQQAFDTVNTHLSCDVSVHKWNKVLEKLLQAVPRKNRVNSVIETLPSGRLDRLIGRRAAAVLRRLLKRMPPDSGPGGEWPHTIAGSTMNENEFFELAARLDRCEIDASVIQ